MGCDYCDKDFENKNDLRNHEKAIHKSKAIMLGCDNCDKDFKNENDLKDHKKGTHNQLENSGISSDNDKKGYNDLKCELCKREFKTEGGLSFHNRLRHNDPDKKINNH